MDLIEGIGERYLMGKANAAPQMLENLAKKQFSSATNTKAQAAQASTLPSPDKDEEIAKLRKQLAETKLEKGKATGEAKAAKSSVAQSIARSSKSTKSKASISEARSSGGSALAKAKKEMKGLPPLSTGEHRTSSSLKARKKSPESTRGRRASNHTATAAAEQAHPRPPSETRSGMHPPSKQKPGKSSAASIASQNLEPSLGAKEALLQTKKSSARHHAASSAASSAHAPSVRRHSVGEMSEAGSNAASVATRPPPPLVPQYEPANHVSRGRAPAYAQVIKQEPVEAYQEDENPEMYIIEVVEEEEEEAPRLMKGVRRRPETGSRGVAEVISSSKGRTVYKVS